MPKMPKIGLEWIGLDRFLHSSPFHSFALVLILHIQLYNYLYLSRPPNWNEPTGPTSHSWTNTNHATTLTTNLCSYLATN